jgi:serine/threonine protein kinase/formylglycine-generating enzyme required for sulfatase activity/cephalosporin-C deacetylase-like acetyl esterase
MDLSPEQWDRVKELYDEALQCDPTQRAAFLLAKTTDKVVRQEVVRLLAAQDTLGSFLSTPPFVDHQVPSGQPMKRFAPGEILAARFRILSFIAAGGMGEVYKAEDTRLDRIVALKFLPKQVADDRDSLERFRREAKAASSLNHPNICIVYDFGDDQGRAFIAMEYLDGETVSARIKKGPIPLDEALKIAVAVAGALSAAHRKGIIHRDLKPGNIMLTSTGAKLLDFGLAKSQATMAKMEDSLTLLTGDGHVVGTLPYMSPEQLLARDVDARGDIFGFGAVLYEVLTGRRAFQRRSSSETILAVDHEEPQPIRELVKDLPIDLERIIRRCLQKQPEDRYQSMADIEHELEECAISSGITEGSTLKALYLRAKRPRVAILAILSFLILMSLLAWWIRQSSQVNWARNQALPQIAKLIEQDKIGEAFALAVQAEGYIPRDPVLAKFWPQISWSEPIRSIPPGASVYRRNYNAPDSPWEFVGVSPIEKRKFAAVDSSWKFELQGYTTVERATFPSGPIAVTLHQDGKAPRGMVPVEFENEESVQSQSITLWGIAGFEALPAVPVASYWIDKFEVTNAEFKRFVDQGGYEKQEYWKHEFRKEGRVLTWTEAMKLFVDKTNRPGPSTWIQGEYPPGEDEYPVMGVSWFEAEAYAEFVGKSLPTIYHWTAAASPTDSSSLIPASNFSGKGPSRVGAYHGMSWCGAYDMAGNVKEWCSNEATSGKRFIMGGAWDEPIYMFNDADARSPFERSPKFGFRCAKYVLTAEEAKAADAPITVQLRNYGSAKPVSDQIFRAYKGQYSYDNTPLNAKVESVQQTEDWRQEKVSFDAAYGGERVTAYLFLPERASAPFQVVVHFPGAGAVHMRSSAKGLPRYLPDFDFIMKSGRALLFPVYKGTFERGGGPKPIYWPNTSSTYRDNVIFWCKDLSRSIDYLETRQDINPNKLAYEGYSWGAAMGGLLPAVETRFKALVLVAPGFYLQDRLPEVDQVNFAPHVKAPVLMLNGRFDFIWPPSISQEPMFRLLGTPTEHKRRVVYDTGHDIPRSEMIKETLDWLDRYLGPVK